MGNFYKYRATGKKLDKARSEWAATLPPKDGFMHGGFEERDLIEDYMRFLEEHDFEIIQIYPHSPFLYFVSFR